MVHLDGQTLVTPGVIAIPALLILILLVAWISSQQNFQQGAIQRTSASHNHGVLTGDGQFRFPIVGESHYQQAIEAIAGGTSEDGARNLRVDALVVPEPTNPYDPNAVVVKIANQTVGYLSRDTAKLFCKALVSSPVEVGTCQAVINGGWDRGHGDRGHFGVRLDVVLPFKFKKTG